MKTFLAALIASAALSFGALPAMADHRDRDRDRDDRPHIQEVRHRRHWHGHHHHHHRHWYGPRVYFGPTWGYRVYRPYAYPYPYYYGGGFYYYRPGFGFSIGF